MMIDADKIQDELFAEQVQRWVEAEKPPTWYDYASYFEKHRGDKATLEGWMQVHELHEERLRAKNGVA